MSSVASFFANYAKAYLTFKPDRLLSFFHIPCLIIDSLGEHMIVQRKDLHYLKPFLDRLQKNGIQKIDAKILVDQTLTAGTCFCSVRYDFQNQHQKTLGDVEAHYILVNDPDGWRITFAKVGHIHSWDLEAA